MDDCFSKEKLDSLFLYDSDGCLCTPESYDIEYKESLQISPDLLKTMSGLANNRGGYIICGVSPDRKLTGLTQEKIDFYNKKIDSETMRGRILSSCQPNIEYKHYLYNLGINKFVLFYIPESQNKPHIFQNNYEDIKEGDIYFRYNDSVRKIRSAELNAIIENKRVQEQEKWMKFLGEIAKIGLDDVLIINAKDGKMISANNLDNGITIDANLLSKFKLIKQGHFSETKGDPTLKLIGNIKLQPEGTYKLTSVFENISEVLDVTHTHPYRYIDILNKLKDENIKTKDNKCLSDKVTFARIRFYILNNNLNNDIRYEYNNTIAHQKTYSQEVYDTIKQAFQEMNLEEIENYKQIPHTS